MNTRIAEIRNGTWLDHYPCRNQKQLYRGNAEGWRKLMKFLIWLLLNTPMSLKSKVANRQCPFQQPKPKRDYTNCLAMPTYLVRWKGPWCGSPGNKTNVSLRIPWDFGSNVIR